MANEDFFISGTIDNRDVRLMLRQFQTGVRRVFISKDIENTILRNIQERFVNQAKQRDPETGRPWVKLHPGTQARRKFNKTTAKKLVDSGSLRDALFIKRARMVDAVTRKPFGISTITVRRNRNSRSSGINLVDIARTHQFGDDSVPARPFLGVSKRESKEIEAIFNTRLRLSTPAFGNPMR